MANFALGLGPLQQESAPLRRKIVLALRHAIETGTLTPGERLVEKDLCAELGVSRTSLREALRELESEGLVGNGTKGLVVTEISKEEALNVYAVRGVLEALVVEQFVQRADDNAMSLLETATAVLTKAYKTRKIENIITAKSEFYEALCTGAQNFVVLEILSRLNSRINRLRFASLSQPQRAPTSITEIQELVEALKRRDSKAAKTIAIKHISSAATAALGGDRTSNTKGDQK